MKGLTGKQALARLERRGGLVRVWRLSHGSVMDFSLVERRGDGIVVEATSKPGSPVSYGRRRFTVTSDLARIELEHEMELVRDRANAPLQRVETVYELIHEDFMSDAGFGQIGCLFMTPSIFVGLVVGAVGSQLATGRIEGSNLLWAVIAGFVLSLIILGPVTTVAYNVPALRDRMDIVAYGWLLIVPGMLTVVVAIVLATGVIHP